MYVGPWQEYRLGQIFNEQTRALAEAVRAQIQQQIQLEQTLRPQLQLQLPQRRQPHGNHHAAGASSYSQSLRNASGQSTPQPKGQQYHASSLISPSSTRSLPPPSAFSPAHPTSSGTLSHSHSSASMSSALAQLPPIQAAARAAVDHLHASRMHATAHHPLAHVVSTYYPELYSTISSPGGSQRSGTRPDSRMSNHSTAVSEKSYFGNPALQYRAPKPRPKKKNKNTPQSHKEHLQRLRSLYNMQGATAGNSIEIALTEEAKMTDESIHGGSRASSSSATSSHSSLHSPASTQFPPLPPHHLNGHTNGSNRSRPVSSIIPPTPPLPVLPNSAISKEMQESIAAYTRDGISKMKPSLLNGDAGPSMAATAHFTAATPALDSSSTPPTNGTTGTPSLSHSASQAGMIAAKSFSTSNSHQLASNLSNHTHPSSPSAHRYLPGTKLSAEQRFMSGLDPPAPLTAASFQFRDRTPTHSSAGRVLHSSGGYSESGEFENEVNDLLGWAAEITNDMDNSPRLLQSRNGTHTAQSMRIHEGEEE